MFVATKSRKSQPLGPIIQHSPCQKASQVAFCVYGSNFTRVNFSKLNKRCSSRPNKTREFLNNVQILHFHKHYYQQKRNHRTTVFVNKLQSLLRAWRLVLLGLVYFKCFWGRTKSGCILASKNCHHIVKGLRPLRWTSTAELHFPCQFYIWHNARSHVVQETAQNEIRPSMY